MTTQTNRAIGIIRVSQRDESAQSPDDQRRKLEAFAIAHDWTMVALLDENVDNGHVKKTASGGALASG